MHPSDVVEDALRIIARDDPWPEGINPKVRNLVGKLNVAGIATYCSGDAYGDDLVYVDLTDRLLLHSEDLKLPEGWIATYQHIAQLRLDVLGEAPNPAAKKQLDQIIPLGWIPKCRLARKGSIPISMDEADAVVAAVLAAAVTDGAGHGVIYDPECDF